MATPQKEQAVQELEERFSKAQALVFTDFRGLNANQMVELRQKLRGQNLEYRVVKNRLAQRAAESAGLSFDGVLEGPTAICFGYDDPVLAFKQSVTLTKEFPNYVIKGGLSEGQFVDADGVKELAELPSHEEILTQLAGTFQGPIRNLTMVLNGLVRQLVVGLSEVAKVKPEPDAGAAEEATAEAEAEAAEAAVDAAEPADEIVDDTAEATAAAETETAEPAEAEDTSDETEPAEEEEEAQAESAETADEPEASADDTDTEAEEVDDESEDDEPTEAEETETEADVDDEAETDDDSDDDSDEEEKGETT